MNQPPMDAKKKFRALALGVMTLSSMLLVTSPASAAVVAASGKVTHVNTYPDFGNGDLVFRLSNTVAGCEGGFWLSPGSLGFSTNVAFLLSSRAQGDTITVGGHNTIIWSGSATPYCKVDWIAVTP